MDVLDIGRSLLASVLVSEVRSKRRPIAAIAGAVVVVGVVAAVLAGGGWRWLFMFVALMATGALITIWIVGIAAIFLLRRYVGNDDIDVNNFGHRRESLDQAIEALDIPTGPLSVARLAWRLRHGVGEEYDRVIEIAGELKTRLEVDL